MDGWLEVSHNRIFVSSLASLPNSIQDHFLYRKVLPDLQAALPAPAAGKMKVKLLGHFLIIFVIHKGAHELKIAFLPGVYIILVNKEEVIEVEALLFVIRYHQKAAVCFFDLVELVAGVDEAKAQALISQVLALYCFEGIVVKHMLELKAEAIFDDALLDIEDHIKASGKAVGDSLEFAGHNHIERGDQLFFVDLIDDLRHILQIFLKNGIRGLFGIADLRHKDVMVHFGYICKAR